MEIFPLRSVLENTRVEPTTKVASMIVGKRYIKIVGSCNGLFCLVQMRYDPNITSAILWNPCTGFTSEPTPEVTDVFAYGGFGYDHTSNSYKLFMAVMDSKYDERTRIFTFSPDYSSWRTIENFDFSLLGHPRDRRRFFPIEYDNEVGVFVSGSNTLRCLKPLYIFEDDVLLAFSPFYNIVLCDLNNPDAALVPVIDEGTEDAISNSFHVYRESLLSPSSCYDDLGN
ncbi:hypothetical protein PIB30_095525, partial [Stylosanthes scabra]|nr:hypothetical protein [Stylosanthes scabra]